MPQVLASAIVDILRPSNPNAFGLFKVTVWGQPPYDYNISYEITAASDTKAAQSAIDKFVNEVTAMGPKGQ